MSTFDPTFSASDDFNFKCSYLLQDAANDNCILGKDGNSSFTIRQRGSFSGNVIDVAIGGFSVGVNRFTTTLTPSYNEVHFFEFDWNGSTNTATVTVDGVSQSTTLSGISISGGCTWGRGLAARPSFSGIL